MADRDSVKNLINTIDNTNSETPETRVINNSIPQSQPLQSGNYQKLQSNVNSELEMVYEIVQLPSEGRLYQDGLKEINIEYLTATDEDILTTASLIQNGSVLDIVLDRKIKSKGVDHRNLLPGDKEALLLFLRTSSYGVDYHVTVSNPIYGDSFKTKVDLSKLKYKVLEVYPDQRGFFTIQLPMSKKHIEFRLLTSGEEATINKMAESKKEAYGSNFSTYISDKIKASIMSIDGNSDRSHINKFVDIMRAGDASFIRKKIHEASPGVDMSYEFTSPDGHTFTSQLSVGTDFFFPQI